MEIPGRSCPLAYRYRPEALARPTRLEADTLYVVGGLYGNPAALRALLERADHEPSGPPTIVFNGDVHWLDVDPDDFRAITDPQPPADGLYGITLDGLRCDAVPLAFDLHWWLTRFTEQWPHGSPAYDRYVGRITGGTPLRLRQAIRGAVTQTDHHLGSGG